MAQADIYYIDTFNFAKATAVYTDAALTTLAADGFYQMGGVTARQQVNGVLDPPQDCPSCAKPSPDTPPAENNAFKITDTVAGTQDHVILDSNYSVNQEVTTSINSNCWLINSLAVNGTSNTITGGCVPDPGTPAEYYLLNLCPVSAGTGAPSAIYTSIPPTSTQFIYENTNSNAYYSYSNAAPINTPSPGIPLVENGLALTADSGCPAVPTVFTYWNAQECNNPNNTIVIQAPDGTTFNEGTTSVKINGSTTCYQINSQRLGSATTFDGVYAGTAYTGCTSGTNPCIPAPVVNNSFLARETTTNVEYFVQLQSGFSVNDNVNISAASGCYKLVSQATNTTSNTITNFCPTVAACATYTATGTGTFNRCTDGVQVSRDFSSEPNQQGEICARLNTASFSGGVTQTGTCFDDIPAPTQYSFYTAVPCDGGAAIIVRTDGNTVNTGTAVKINNAATCYEITGGSGLTTNTNDITNRSDNCAVCNPPSNCFAIPIEYNSNTNVCPTGGNTTVFADTSSLSTATQLYASEQGCASSQAAATGTYAFTSQGSKISRYWNGSTLGNTTTCSSTPQNITGTITSITNNITGSTEGVGYNLVGDTIGSFVTGASPLDTTTFNSRILVTDGFSIANSSVTFDPTSITQDSDITLIVGGQITQDAASFTYLVTTCGTFLSYRITHSSSLANSTVVFFRTNTGQTFCGTIQGTTTATSQGDVIQEITSSGCNNSMCTGGGFS
jgi:hypothetical protein